MNHNSGGKRLSDACRRGTSYRILEKYIHSCRFHTESEEDEKNENTEKRAKAKRSRERFPNLAGFCRYLKISSEELEKIWEEYPVEIERLYAILEDEALNSDLPPAILSAYLKRRLGYEKETDDKESESGPIQILFEHNIFRDGE